MKRDGAWAWAAWLFIVALLALAILKAAGVEG